jgi:simple sugar transport system substrate-binding protein
MPMKRLIYSMAVAAAAVAAVAVSVARADDSDKKLHFAMVTHEIGSGFFAPHKQAAEDFAKRYGVTVDFMGPQIWDINEHVNILENLIAKGVDGIATTTVDPRAYRGVVRKALDAGIPVVGFNNDDAGGSDRLAFVGQYDAPAGKVAGEQALKYLGGADKAKGKTALVFICCPGFTALELRAKALKETLESAGVNVKGPIEYTADPSKVYGNIEAAYLANPDAAALLSVDAFTWVLSDFVAKNDLGGKVVAGGWDMLPQTLKGIKDGNVKFTVGSNPYITAYYALLDLYFDKTKGIPPISIDTGVTFVDSTNVSAFTDVAKKEVAH